MAIFDELKSIGKVLQEAGKIELYQQILNIQKSLLEMQDRIRELEEENNDLKEKNKIKEALIYENDAYWKKEGDKKEGPFCLRCWDKNKDLMRMQSGRASYFFCPECKTTIEIKFPVDNQ